MGLQSDNIIIVTLPAVTYCVNVGYSEEWNHTEQSCLGLTCHVQDRALQRNMYLIADDFHLLSLLYSLN